MKKTVFGFVKSRPHLERVVEHLHLSSLFDDNDISTLFMKPKILSKTSSGEYLRGLDGFGEIDIFGEGQYICAGPLKKLLNNSTRSTPIQDLSPIASMFVQNGLSDYVAKRYDNMLKESFFLISIQCETIEQANQAINIFDKEGLHDIASTKEMMKI